MNKPTRYRLTREAFRLRASQRRLERIAACLATSETDYRKKSLLLLAEALGEAATCLGAMLKGDLPDNLSHKEEAGALPVCQS